MFGCLLELLENIWQVKRCKTFFRDCLHYLGVPKLRKCFAPNASILLHWSLNVVWLSLEAFRKPSACKKMQNLCFEHECPSLE
jgi:hypothetical protein